MAVNSTQQNSVHCTKAPNARGRLIARQTSVRKWIRWDKIHRQFNRQIPVLSPCKWSESKIWRRRRRRSAFRWLWGRRGNQIAASWTPLHPVVLSPLIYKLTLWPFNTSIGKWESGKWGRASVRRDGRPTCNLTSFAEPFRVEFVVADIVVSGRFAGTGFSDAISRPIRFDNYVWV